MFNLGIEEVDQWQREGNCYQRRQEVQDLNDVLGYDIFYPETGKGQEAKKWSDKFCQNCPVLVRCYYEGLYESGIWGGATANERRRQQRLQSTLISDLTEHLAAQLPDENTPPTSESGPDPVPS